VVVMFVININYLSTTNIAQEVQSIILLQMFCKRKDCDLIR